MSETGNGHGERQRRIFTLGEMMRIRTGVFSSFTGKIEGINQSKLLLKVRVTIFGRPTPIKLQFTDVEKVTFTQD